MTSEDTHFFEILSRFEADPETTQRSLSNEIGIALGLTNLLVRNLVRKGWVRVIHVKSNRVRYLLTPTGVAEKARMSRDAIYYSITFYTRTRNRIRERLNRLTTAIPNGAVGGAQGRVVFFGAGEVAEIAYVCLQDHELVLAGVVDDLRTGARFFGLPIRSTSDLDRDRLCGVRYDRLAVMSFADPAEIQPQLTSRLIPLDRVFWL
jgi:DNA-binding MarR family transcriptional regulator